MAGTLIVSLDFELFWGMLDCTTLEEYQDNVLGGRKAIPQLLQLFNKYGVHATWATVGFMFAHSYEELQKYFPAKELLPAYDNPELSPYKEFEKIGTDEASAPCFYAPSLIELVSKAEGQEIGTHTFSHYYCREKGQTKEQFEADIKAALALASAHGYELKSVVMPRNQCTDACVDVLAKAGFLTYRDEENDWIHKIKNRSLLRILRLADVYLPLTGAGGYVPRKEQGLVNLIGSRMYKPYFKPLKFMEGMKVSRIKKQMLHAAKNGLTFHLWWHPHNIGVQTEFHLQQLEEIFSYYSYLKETYGMVSLNMREAAEEVLKGN